MKLNHNLFGFGSSNELAGGCKNSYCFLKNKNVFSNSRIYSQFLCFMAQIHNRMCLLLCHFEIPFLPYLS